MSEVRKWLEAIGLGQYGDAFEANEIGMDLLGQVDDQMLKDIGVSIGGHRLRIREAIAKLTSTPIVEANLRGITPTQEATAASAERRQLTVMFCDLVGSTALSARLDPEDLRDIIGTYHRCCTELIERNGGFVARHLGDGVLAYFGYPQAHEHDAERAVRAGLGLVEAVPKLATNAGSTLHVRVGIATGHVVVGDLIGAGAAQEQAVVGETPNLAARLQALAEPGAVVIASSTRRLTGELFEYHDLGAVVLKGFAEDVPAWQVLGAGIADSRFEALRATTTPLIGRDEEIDLLMRRWQHAKRGDGCVVLISGEPGIGKSRIAQTTLERLNAEPHTRLRYFCSPHHQDSALYPIITQLERAAAFRHDDTDERRVDKLETLLTQATNELSGAVPLLGDLLSIPTGDRYSVLNLTPQKRKEKTLQALVAHVEGLATHQPVLMSYEDMHWSDPTTREWLDLLIDRVPTLCVLVIITFRSEFAPPWVGRPHVTLLSLSRLGRRECAEMITHIAGQNELPKEIVDQIVDRTDGVPLFIEELTKSIVESDVLTGTRDRYLKSGTVVLQGIPTTLHASLLARLDRLTSAREVAQIAAALGRQFSHELIGAVAAMPKQQLDDSLEQLVRAELIFRRRTPPDAEYVFKHALVQDAAYDMLLRSRRQQLHAHIATTLEGKYPEIVAAHPPLLARHCTEAGLAEKAVVYWLRAGQQAIERSATKEAVAQLQKGLDLLVQMPNTPWRQQHELDLQFTLGRALEATKGYSAPEVAETIARARALAEGMDRPEHLVLLSLGQWRLHLLRAEHKLALALAEQIAEFGEARNDVAAQLQGRSAKAWTRCYLGHFVTARALLEQCLMDPRYRAISGGLTEDPYTVMLAEFAATLMYLGYFDQAKARLNEALSEPLRLKHVHTLAVALNFANRIESITCPILVQRCIDELLALSIEHGFSLFYGWATACRGSSLIALGRAQEGLTLLMEDLTAVRATGCMAITPILLIRVAEASAMLGQPLEGLNYLAEAISIIEMTEERRDEAELHRLRGDLLNAVGDRAAAEESYHQALAMARRQGAKIFEILTATSLARFWRDDCKRVEARELLLSVYGWFTEGFDTPVLKEAKLLLGQLG
jgi:class 3 adenylate cyclase/predicted negative regulator of RcsB-dependent stress response